MFLTYGVHLKLTHGRHRVTEQDANRARQAAFRVFERAALAQREIGPDLNATPRTVAEAAWISYFPQWEAGLVGEQVDGLGAIWVQAQDAADLALTEGWDDPDGAACAITL